MIFALALLGVAFAFRSCEARWDFGLGLRHFQVGSYPFRSIIEGLYYRSLIAALYTLNSPPVVSFS